MQQPIQTITWQITVILQMSNQYSSSLNTHLLQRHLKRHSVLLYTSKPQLQTSRHNPVNTVKTLSSNKLLLASPDPWSKYKQVSVPPLLGIFPKILGFFHFGGRLGIWGFCQAILGFFLLRAILKYTIKIWNDQAYCVTTSCRWPCFCMLV